VRSTGDARATAASSTGICRLLDRSKGVDRRLRFPAIPTGWVRETTTPPSRTPASPYHTPRPNDDDDAAADADADI